MLLKTHSRIDKHIAANRDATLSAIVGARRMHDHVISMTVTAEELIELRSQLNTQRALSQEEVAGIPTSLFGIPLTLASQEK